jgi:hypothetical protein
MSYDHEQRCNRAAFDWILEYDSSSDFAIEDTHTSVGLREGNVADAARVLARVTCDWDCWMIVKRLIAQSCPW